MPPRQTTFSRAREVERMMNRTYERRAVRVTAARDQPSHDDVDLTGISQSLPCLGYAYPYPYTHALALPTHPCPCMPCLRRARQRHTMPGDGMHCLERPRSAHYPRRTTTPPSGTSIPGSARQRVPERLRQRVPERLRGCRVHRTTHVGFGSTDMPTPPVGTSLGTQPASRRAPPRPPTGRQPAATPAPPGRVCSAGSSLKMTQPASCRFLYKFQALAT